MPKITQVKDPYAKKRGGFGSIRSGDISRWAKGKSHFQYPEPKIVKPTIQAVSNLDLCTMRPIQRRAKPVRQVMVAGLESPKTVAERTNAMDIVDMSSKIAAALSSLGRTS